MRNKIIIISFIIIVLSSFSFSIFSEEDTHGKSVDEVLEIIRDDLGVKTNAEINPDKVKDKHLEELGEAVMSLMHPDERQHELMDNMMGGEGSKSLESAHIMMGYRYLSGNNYRGNGYRGNNYGMHGNFNNGIGIRGWGMPMHGYNSYPGRWSERTYSPYGGLIMMFFGLLLVLAAIAVFVIFYKRNNMDISTPLEILKKRYAKGEITEQEFETMKKKLH